MKRIIIAITIALAGCAGAPQQQAAADPDFQACDYEARKAAAGVLNPFDRGFTIGQLRSQCMALRGR